MAKYVKWKIPFKSLRDGTDYCVYVYEENYMAPAIILKGAAQPFVTEEDNDDDVFKPVRTQSGYIRIVDDGYGINESTNEAVDFNWKNFIPGTDTSHPVILTRTVSGATTKIWYGFMQAQNFSGTLYGNPQERDFPVQCILSVLEGTDINYQQTGIQNFAYLLKQIVDAIPKVGNNERMFSQIIVQGGTHAQSWLMKRIDWQNFVNEDSEGNLSARFNLFQCLEDLCRFWGWTARTYMDKILLMCADDSGETSSLGLNYSALESLAAGTSAGSSFSAFSYPSWTGDIFANVNQADSRQRGPNKSIVRADGNSGEKDMIKIYPDAFIKEMVDGGTYAANGGGFGGSNLSFLRYTNDKTTFDKNFLYGNCRSGYATFNVMFNKANASDIDGFNTIRIKKSFSTTSETAFATLNTKYVHVLADGIIDISAKIYLNGELSEDYNEDTGVGNKHMYIRIGIGKDRENAIWYTGGGWSNTGWSNTMTAVKVTIGSKDNNILTGVKTPDNCEGKLYIDFLGSDDIDENNGQRGFEIVDFLATYMRNSQYYQVTSNVHGNFASLMTDKEFVDIREYRSSNQNNVREEWNADCIYASDNQIKFGYGVLANANSSYMTTANYGAGTERPEQHLANRVTSYWSSAKRKMELEVRSDMVTVTPEYKPTIDLTRMYPIAISRDWHDDIISLTLLEM